MLDVLIPNFARDMVPSRDTLSFTWKIEGRKCLPCVKAVPSVLSPGGPAFRLDVRVVTFRDSVFAPASPLDDVFVSRALGQRSQPAFEDGNVFLLATSRVECHGSCLRSLPSSRCAGLLGSKGVRGGFLNRACSGTGDFFTTSTQDHKSEGWQIQVLNSFQLE